MLSAALAEIMLDIFTASHGIIIAHIYYAQYYVFAGDYNVLVLLFAAGRRVHMVSATD